MDSFGVVFLPLIRKWFMIGFLILPTFQKRKTSTCSSQACFVKALQDLARVPAKASSLNFLLCSSRLVATHSRRLGVSNNMVSVVMVNFRWLLSLSHIGSVRNRYVCTYIPVPDVTPKFSGISNSPDRFQTMTL
jgi:hypothetical protein